MKPFALILTAIIALVCRLPGVEIISKPKLRDYPGYGCKGKIRVLVSKFYDADGYILEVNQILSD